MSLSSSEIRFKDDNGNDFPDWEEKRVDELAFVNPKSSALPERFLYIDLESVTKGRLRPPERIAKADAPSRAQRLLNKGDILFQCVRPYQKNNYLFNLDGAYVASTGFAQLRTGDNNLEFLYQSLHIHAFSKAVWSRCTGTSYPAINSNDLAEIKVFVPHVPEQKKIADFLTSVDDRIGQLIKKKALLEDYKKGVMQQLFSQQIRFKDDNGNDFPDWEEKKLGEVSDVRDGTHESPKYQVTGHPLVTSKNLQKDGTIDMSNVDLISEEDFQAINKRSNVDKGDIVFGMIGTIGNPVIVSEAGFAIKNVALIKEQIQLLNKFLIHYLESTNIARQFHVENTGGTQKFIALGVIRKLLIRTPSPIEQKKIADFLSAIDQKIERVSEQIAKTQTFKKGLLQQMFV